jgi:hypothetical protein
MVTHDVNPRAMSPKVKGFVQAQSWYQDLTPIKDEENHGISPVAGRGSRAARTLPRGGGGS